MVRIADRMSASTEENTTMEPEYIIPCALLSLPAAFLAAGLADLICHAIVAIAAMIG